MSKQDNARWMRSAYGAEPGKTCGECAHCAINECHGKYYRKCKFCIVTGGAGSDIRKGDMACQKFEQVDAEKRAREEAESFEEFKKQFDWSDV